MEIIIHVSVVKLTQKYQISIVKLRLVATKKIGNIICLQAALIDPAGAVRKWKACGQLTGCPITMKNINRRWLHKIAFFVIGFQTLLHAAIGRMMIALIVWLGLLSSLFISGMSNLSQVTILYGENKLQKTIKLPSSTTVTDAKKKGSEVILQHLHDQSGVPPSRRIWSAWCLSMWLVNYSVLSWR